jgi:hypothetical protein
MNRFERAAQLWAVLVLAARHRQVLSYDLVARATGVPRAAVGGFLWPIQPTEFRYLGRSWTTSRLASARRSWVQGSL